jgi:hypothetical protein
MRSATIGAKPRLSPKLWHSNTARSFSTRKSFRTQEPSRLIRNRCRCAVFCFTSSLTKS